MLAERTELVEVQRHALYRLCELSANNAIDKDQVARMSDDILQTLRVLALSTAANKDNERVMLALIDEGLIHVPRVGDRIATINQNTGNLQVSNLAAPSNLLPLPATANPIYPETKGFIIDVKYSINCNLIDSIDKARLETFADSVGIDPEKILDESQLRAEVGRFCMSTSLSLPNP